MNKSFSENIITNTKVPLAAKRMHPHHSLPSDSESQLKKCCVIILADIPYNILYVRKEDNQIALLYNKKNSNSSINTFTVTNRG